MMTLRLSLVPSSYWWTIETNATDSMFRCCAAVKPVSAPVRSQFRLNDNPTLRLEPGGNVGRSDGTMAEPTPELIATKCDLMALASARPAQTKQKNFFFFFFSQSDHLQRHG